MQLHELKEQLVKKTLQPLYIFTGEEIAIMNIYIDKIAKIAGSKAKRVDSVGSIFGKLQNQSFMNKPSCYVIRDDKDYLAQEKIWDSLNNGLVQGNNIIILVYSNLDKRSKFYKHHADMVTEFQKLSPEVLAKYIIREIGLDINKAAKFAELCDCNYNRILLECDKVKHLAQANNINIDQAYDIAIRENLIHTSPKDVIFELIDAVCKRQPERSYNLLEELTAINENPLGAISLLYTNFRSMLLVQSAGAGADITKRTGLTGWQVKLAKEKGVNYSVGELVTAIRMIRETEKGIKTGMIEQVMALDYILANVM
jgi:DNA polymerase III delta subunit